MGQRLFQACEGFVKHTAQRHRDAELTIIDQLLDSMDMVNEGVSVYDASLDLRIHDVRKGWPPLSLHGDGMSICEDPVAGSKARVSRYQKICPR